MLNCVGKMYKTKLPELYLLSHQTQYMAIIAVFRQTHEIEIRSSLKMEK